MDNQWTTNGQPMDNQWTTNGQPMDNQWTTNGQPMGGIGKEPRIYTATILIYYGSIIHYNIPPHMVYNPAITTGYSINNRNSNIS
jgi:hypothetical protein